MDYFKQEDDDFKRVNDDMEGGSNHDQNDGPLETELNNSDDENYESNPSYMEKIEQMQDGLNEIINKNVFDPHADANELDEHHHKKRQRRGTFAASNK